MPIYEYECQKCHAVFETIVSSSSKGDAKCAKCGSSEVDKLISAMGMKVAKGAALSSASSCQPRGGFT